MSRSKRDQELKEELEVHLRMAAQDRIDRGEAPVDAEAHARRDLGNMTLIQEVTSELNGWTGVRRFLQDAHYGVRVLRRNPTFAVVSLLTLALGVAASTAIFSVVYGVLLRPLPYDRPGQIVRIWEKATQGHRMSFADPNFADMRSQTRSLQGMAEFDYGIESVSGSSEPARVGTAYVSHDFFRVMGVQPVMGRTFLPAEEQQHGPSVALLSYSFWSQSLGSPRDLRSITLRIEQKPTSVIGILPPGFHYPDDAQIWLSADTGVKYPSRTAHNYHVIGRLRDGVTLEQAHSELNGIARRIKQQYGQDVDLVATDMVPLREALTETTRPSLLILMGVSGLLLLVACANVMNLLLGQATGRHTEFAIRSALGASRFRLVRQFLAESLVLCLAGGFAGAVLSFFAVQGLLAVAPRDIPRLDEVSVNLPVLLFALAVSTAVAVGLGVLTAFRTTAGDVQSKLAEGGRVQGSSTSSQRAGHGIVMAQMAVTVVLLVGAGLLGRSFLRVLSVDPGFRTDRVLTMEVALPEVGDNKIQRIEFLSRALDGLRALPGVTVAGGTTDLPLESGYGSDGTFCLLNPQQLSSKQKQVIQKSVDFKGEPGPADFKALDDFFDPLFHDKAHTGHAEFIVASTGYFQALGIPLKRGRLFNDADNVDAPHVALISESLARTVWPDRDPVGESIEFGNMDGDLRLLRIVGIVGDVRGNSLEEPPKPTVYVSYRQRPNATHSVSFVLRTPAEPSSMIAAARRTIRELDPAVPVRFTTFTNVVASSLNVRRFNLTLVTIFSGAALLLAIVGIYGVLAYSVARRTRELGVRIALGASSSNVLGLVLRQAVATAAAGVVVGGIAAYALTRFMRSIVFGVSTSDPLTYAAVAALLLVGALLAAYIPARRATRMDPMIALRAE
ncbi:MAG TPA: ABC transporter permease [Terriglobales bacterium]|nr:ABC transporter permease [Terriglobales bacterium]